MAQLKYTEHMFSYRAEYVKSSFSIETKKVDNLELEKSPLSYVDMAKNPVVLCLPYLIYEA